MFHVVADVVVGVNVDVGDGVVDVNIELSSKQVININSIVLENFLEANTPFLKMLDSKLRIPSRIYGNSQ